MMQEKAGTAQDVNKNYSAITQPDGIFRVEDVAPGTYTLDIRVYQRGQHGNADYKKPIGKILHDFTVPELAEGDEDNPLDLGTITLENEVEKSQGLIGQPVPELTAETLDGDTLRLSDYRGKIVLLNFWTFQKQETAEAEMENMKSIYETFADEDTFDVLGLTMGGFGILGKELAQKYVDEKGIPWPQAIIKMGDFYKLHETFGLNKYPFNVLIGPDGKIIAAGLEGDELKTKVAEAIAAVKEPKEAPTP
jgi:peroxiredoxin